MKPGRKLKKPQPKRGRPPLPADVRKVRVHISVDPHVLAAADAYPNGASAFFNDAANSQLAAAAS